MIEIYATYNGERFPVKIGEEYEFSHTSEFNPDYTFKLILKEISNNAVHPFRGEYCKHNGRSISFNWAGFTWFKYIRPIQKAEPRFLTHKEIAMNLVGKGVFKENETTAWFTQWFSGDNVSDYTFCFFSDLDTDHEKWHQLTTELLDMIKERE